MNKLHVEEQKKTIMKNLEAQRALLKEKGVTGDEIMKNAVMRKLRAEGRQADLRLARIAELEKQKQTLAQAKAEKLAAGKKPKGPKKEEKVEAPPKKEKKAKGEGKKPANK
jgi:hypothetical protein